MNGSIFPLFNPIRNVTYYATMKLAEGGFGEVWAGNFNGYPVAIKFFKFDAATNVVTQRWDSEQRIHLRCLKHPCIVQTFDQFRTRQGHLVIIMERASGTLHDLLNSGRRSSPQEVCRIGLSVLSALSHLHGLRIIHRDVTMRNVLYFRNGDVKLGDFGIAKPLVTWGEIATTQIGAAGFHPPELLLLGHSTMRSDLYQVGLVMLSLLYGRQIIPSEISPSAQRLAILQGIPRQIAERSLQYGKLSRVLAGLLCRTERLRYQTAESAMLDLQDALSQWRPTTPGRLSGSYILRK